MKKALTFLLLLFVIVACKKDKPIASTAPQEIALSDIAFTIPANFKLEEIYSPSQHGQGSWVALAQGPNNTMFASDQRGKLYSFKVPTAGESVIPSTVDSINLNIGEAHGLLWAHNALYVSVNKRWKDDVSENEQNASGIYKLTDTNKDGKLDNVTQLLKLNGAGEHGPHSFVPSPDGKDIYFIAGNHVLIPDVVKNNSLVPTNWGEDNIFTPYLDARGHANDIKAPGGWIAKFSPNGTNWQLISAGYRNPFDMAFNADGELFAYDADMEWDIGMPWYRPTRICHVTSGSEFGWRTGSGKWPAYYPDNLPGVQNLEQGSPTGVLSTNALNFPSQYTDGLLVMDWSFGTIYHIKLKPEGSSYTGEREEFLSGTPLPLTDMIAGTDGNLYFATGGRGLDSHLYKISYTGDIKNNKDTHSTDEKLAELRSLRQQLEAYHTKKSADGITLAWNNLKHDDRFIQYAARVALEHQPTTSWAELFTTENNATTQIQAAIALAHQADKKMEATILEKLNNLTLETLSSKDQIDLLRAYALTFIRMGQPDPKSKTATMVHLNAYFPNSDDTLNRELAQLLLYLEADGAVKNTVALLEKHTKEKTITKGVEMLSEEATLRSEQYGPLIRDVIAKMPPSESIYYGMLLSYAKKGWTDETRASYFKWFFDVMNSKGGMSFKAYIENVRQQAMLQIPEKDKAHYQALSGIYAPTKDLADLPQPIGPGKTYTMAQARRVYDAHKDNYKGTVADGERAFKAALCISCHRMKGEGGATGPDLTQIHTKFSSNDLTFALVSPNDAISDQYANSVFTTKDNKKIVGRLLNETNDTLTIMPNAYNPSYTIKLSKTNVASTALSPVSPMPPGLLNRLNEKEITDLYSYLLSGGDKNHKIYKGE